MSEMKKSVPYNEDQEQEIEALQAIFMENFKFENGEISIDVVPHMGGADSNFIQVRFKVRFPPEYPNVGLTSKNFKLEVTVGALHPSYIFDLEQTIISESQNYLGQSMLFLLVDHIKDKLEMYNLDLAEGLFVLFSDEIIINIFSFLDVLSLAKLSLVNKKLKRLSEDDELWRNFVSDGVSESEQGLKKRYIEINELQAPELEYISAVMERKGTGDEWQSHLENWREAFKRKLKEEHDLELMSSGLIKYKHHVAGYYRFWERENIENVKKPWLQTMENYKCPYIGKVFGYIRWYPVTAWRKVILHRIPECSRGITVNLRTNSHFFSVIQDRIFLSHLFSSGNKSFMLKQPGPPVRYLNDLVELLNKKITKMVEEDKAGKYRGFGMMYVRGTWLEFDNFPILQELQTKWGKIWMFHERETIDEILGK